MLYRNNSKLFSTFWNDNTKDFEKLNGLKYLIVDCLKFNLHQSHFNLDQAILDNEVITSPENISRLAKEHLEDGFRSYKKSQIIQLEEDQGLIISTKKVRNSKY